MTGIYPRLYRLKTEDKPTKSEASVHSELIILDAATGEVDSYWVMADRVNPITGDYWWQL